MPGGEGRRGGGGCRGGGRRADQLEQQRQEETHFFFIINCVLKLLSCFVFNGTTINNVFKSPISGSEEARLSQNDGHGRSGRD